MLYCNDLEFNWVVKACEIGGSFTAKCTSGKVLKLANHIMWSYNADLVRLHVEISNVLPFCQRSSCTKCHESAEAWVNVKYLSEYASVWVTYQVKLFSFNVKSEFSDSSLNCNWYPMGQKDGVWFLHVPDLSTDCETVYLRRVISHHINQQLLHVTVKLTWKRHMNRQFVRLCISQNQTVSSAVAPTLARCQSY